MILLLRDRRVKSRLQWLSDELCIFLVNVFPVTGVFLLYLKRMCGNKDIERNTMQLKQAE